MSIKTQALRNITSTWFALAANIAVGFFLSPFILHRLGDDAFGLWVLVVSITGYYGFLDLGIRSSIIRYVARFAAGNEHDQLSRIVSTSFFTYTCVALLLLGVTIVAAFRIEALFRVSPDSLSTARALLLVVGIAVALRFPLEVFGGVLEGLQRFSLLNLTQVAGALLRGLLILLALNHGGGLLSVAVISVVIPVIVASIYMLVVLFTTPIHIETKLVDRRSLRTLVSYGSISFIFIAADQLRFQTDAVIIGMFLSTSAIAYFSIGAKLADYAIMPVNSMASVFMPLCSQFDAVNDVDRLRKMLIEGNRVCAFIMCPICVALVILGRSLIEIWVGPKYAVSYIILVLLLVPKALYRMQAVSNRILFGMARHRPLAVVALLEGSANVILSVALIRKLGIVGDALGTTIPLTITSLVFLPVYLCRVLQVPLRTFFSEIYLLPLALSIPMAVALVVLQRFFYAHTYGQLLIQLVAGSLAYGLGILWLFFSKEPLGIRLWMRLRAFLPSVSAR